MYLNKKNIEKVSYSNVVLWILILNIILY